MHYFVTIVYNVTSGNTTIFWVWQSLQIHFWSQNNPYKKFLASFSALLAWPWQSMICQQSQQILADFILAFLAFVGKMLYLPRIVGSTGGLLPSKLGKLGNLPNLKAYCQ